MEILVTCDGCDFDFELETMTEMDDLEESTLCESCYVDRKSLKLIY